MFLDCILLHNHWTGSNCFCGTLLGLTPATHRYKVYFYVVNYHQVTTLTEGDTLCDTLRDTWRDTNTLSSQREVLCVVQHGPSRIRNSIYDY